MSHKLLVFLGNKIYNVRYGDVELLGLLVGVCCTLGLDCTPVDLTGVVCVTVPGVERTAH